MTLERPDSVFYGRDRDLLPKLLDFYAAPDARVLDCTANRRRMWEGVVREPAPVFMDLDPAMEPDVVGDFRALPFADASFDVLVFDPPHLPQAAASAKSDAAFGARYGLAHVRCGWALYYDCADCAGMGIFGKERPAPGLHEALHVLALTQREAMEELAKETCHALRPYGGPAFRAIRWLVVPRGAWGGYNPVWESPRLPPFEPRWQLFPSGGLTEGSSSLIVSRNEPLAALVKLGANIHRIEADGLVTVTLPSVWEVAL